MKKNNYFIFALLFFIANVQFSLFGQESIVLRSKPHGMFSMFHFVLYFLQEYDRSKIDGFKVDFAETGLYYDETIGLNWWEYYFEPIILGNQGPCSQVRIIEEDTYIDPNSIEFSNSLEINHNLVQKYIKIKSHIFQKVEAFQIENFQGKFVIGIHYRGTDKLFYEAPKVSYDSVIESVYEIMTTIPKGIECKIFVATDELPFLQSMQYEFLSKVCYCKLKRSSNGSPLHLDLSRNPYQTGEAALVDALLLSSVNFLIRISSNLSLCSRYFNPELPVIELSQRTQETIPCAEFYP